MIAGFTSYPHFSALWTLAATVADLCGDAAALVAIGEHATDAAMAPWSAFPQEEWQQGRLFGARGELRWRTYGQWLRVVVLLDAADQEIGPWRAQLTTQGVGVFHYATYTTQDETVALWPHGAYVDATVRYYRDDDGVIHFVRYCAATPTTAEANDGA